MNIKAIKTFIKNRDMELRAVRIISNTHAIVLVDTNKLAHIEYAVWDYYHHEEDYPSTHRGDYFTNLDTAREYFNKRISNS